MTNKTQSKGARSAPRATGGGSGNRARATAPASRSARKGTPMAAASAAPAAAQPKSAVRVAPARAKARKRQKQGFPVPLWAIAGVGTLVVVLVLLVLASQQTPQQVTNTNAPIVGQAAPDFSVDSTDGTNYTLSKLKGQVVMLEFMAPWCPHCQADAPMFAQLYTSYKDKGVQILGINATPYGKNYEQGDNSLITVDDMKWFATTYNVPFPLLFNKSLSVANDYAVQAFPTVYIVDKTSKIHAHLIYPFDATSLGSALDAALAAGG